VPIPRKPVPYHDPDVDRVVYELHGIRDELHTLGHLLHALVRRQQGNLSAEEEAALAARVTAMGAALDASATNLQSAVDAAKTP